MKKEIKITIENKLLIDKRDMAVYHCSTKSAHIISHDNSYTLPLRSVLEDDYLYLSIVGGAGQIQSKCVVSLPSWIDFEFLNSPGNVALTRSDDRTLVKIPPGFPGWQLKLTHSATHFIKRSDCVIISEER